MDFSPGSGFSIISFIAVLVAICFSIIFGIGVASERLEFSVNKEVIRACAVLIIWLGGYSLARVTAITSPLPLGPVFLLLAVVVPVGVSLSSYGSRLALGLSLNALVSFQVVRLPMELILHQWVLQGTVPTTVSWSGSNWDVLSGILALCVAPFAKNHPWIAWLFNIFGSVMLGNFLFVLVMSTPVSFGWHVSPPMRLTYHLPYFLISPIYFGSIVACHVILTRALLFRSK
ncbi:MAG: hypothetical protein ACKOX6_01395 [Bdellovibrio sp.]